MKTWTAPSKTLTPYAVAAICIRIFSSFGRDRFFALDIRKKRKKIHNPATNL